MSQALNNLKKLIIEMVEEEVSTNEYGNTQAKKKKQKGLEEKLNLFLEKNKPTNPSKWSYYKSQAKKKFDVYPSAYANAWAAKKYKAAGGGWKKEQIGEASVTGNLDGGEGPPKTPYAFQSKKKRKQDKDKEDAIATAGGYMKVNEDYSAMFIEISKAIKVNRPDGLNAIRDLADEYDIGRVLYMARTNPKGLRKAVADRVKERKQFIKSKNLRELKEGRYHQWRNDESLTPKQKIGRSIREVKNSLNELDKTIKMNQRLKNELKVDSKDYWKTTHKALSSISERLVRLASRVGNLR
jgi:hypothetical protein